ncbi:MAG TPA: twin-arginine translocation signal domain-containing protein [Candidatus Angelobacter sp.]|nr:twin-arginine translocation signal domain-containing protein [Candidatus Angelobacter sp.]
MSKPNDEPKGLDRRSVMKAALAVGGASLLGGVAAMPQNAVVSEREWARVLARHVANQLQEAVRTVPELGLTQVQVVELRQAFENTLVANMGCDVPTDQPPTDQPPA